MFFGEWHGHYFRYEYDYNVMKETAADIINGDTAAVNLHIENICYCNILRKISEPFFEPYELIEEMNLPDEFIELINQNGAEILINCWNPNDCRKYKINK